MQSVTIHTSFVVATLWFLLGLHLISISAPSGATGRISARLAPSLLALNCFLWAIQNTLLACNLLGAPQQLVLLRPILAMLLGPSLYFYYLVSTRPHFQFRAHQFIHLLPLLVLTFLLFADLTKAYFLIDAFILISMSSYTLFIMLNLSSVQRLTSDENLNNEAEDKREYKKEVYLWLWLVSGMMLISVVVDIAILIELMLTNKPLAESVWLAFGSTLFLLFSAFVLLCFLRRSSLFEWVYVLGEARRQKYASSKLTDEDCKQYFKKLERLLNSNKPYKDGRLKLGDVAKLLELNPRVLSEVVNRRCAMNFSSYLNTYRVEEVKRLLLAEPEKNITELMFDSGFVTKSTFNKEFARVCGCSPSAYRAQNLP